MSRSRPTDMVIQVYTRRIVEFYEEKKKKGKERKAKLCT